MREMEWLHALSCLVLLSWVSIYIYILLILIVYALMRCMSHEEQMPCWLLKQLFSIHIISVKCCIIYICIYTGQALIHCVFWFIGVYETILLNISVRWVVTSINPERASKRTATFGNSVIAYWSSGIMMKLYVCTISFSDFGGNGEANGLSS